MQESWYFDASRTVRQQNWSSPGNRNLVDKHDTLLNVLRDDIPKQANYELQHSSNSGNAMQTAHLSRQAEAG